MNTHDIEAVLRSYLTGDGYIAADDIPAICAAIEADRKRRGEPVTLEAERLATNRYRPVPDGVFAYKVVAGDGRRSLFSGSKDECYVVARKLTEAFLDGAFAATNAAPQPTESSRGEPVNVTEGFRLIAVNETFDSLMFWLDRCEQKGHLENCADLTEPWEKFEYREVESQQPQQQGSEPVAEVPSDAELEKAWDSFEAEMARHPTDDELEEFMAQFADEAGHIHDDQHAEAARALLASYGNQENSNG